MRLVYKFHIPYNEQLYNLCKISKNLYNQTLYIIKQELKTNNRWLSYYDTDKMMKDIINLEGEINYKLLKAQVAQQCLKQLDKNVKSYVKSIKDWKKHKEKYRGMPHFPSYKGNVNQLVYTNQCASIKDGFINLSKDLKLFIPQWNKYKERLSAFQQIRILPLLDKTFDIEIVYNVKDVINERLDNDRYASIDLGIDNLVTLVMDKDKPLLFNGRSVKSKNQWFNKEISKLKSALPKGKRTSKRIRNLYSKRNRQMSDTFHKMSRYIVNILIKNGIGNIVVGYNRGWKDSIQIGKRNNQTFVSIPYDLLIGYLTYKCELCGIKVIITEESYTSKCDALANEEIGKHSVYLGKRVKRGLYCSSIGKLVNADVNGALNIMRKVIGDSPYIKEIIDSGLLFNPMRVKTHKGNY